MLAIFKSHSDLVEQRLIKKVKPFTMLDDARLKNILHLALSAHGGGDFVECGTCRGGSAALLAYGAKVMGWDRDVWLFDSFAGHPEPTIKSGSDKDLMKEWAGTMIASKADAIKALQSVEAYNPERVHIVAGWFSESLPKSKIEIISLLHIDADWYDSTLFCLENLYPKVARGGHIVVDDYESKEFLGVKEAVDLFVKKNHISLNKKKVVKPALIFQKP